MTSSTSEPHVGPEKLWQEFLLRLAAIRQPEFRHAYPASADARDTAAFLAELCTELDRFLAALGRECESHFGVSGLAAEFGKITDLGMYDAKVAIDSAAEGLRESERGQDSL